MIKKYFILFIFLSIFIFSFHSILFAQTAASDNVCTQVQCVKIQNGSLWVLSSDNTTYVPYFVKAVGYQPTPIGRQPNDWGYALTDPRSSINNVYDDPAILNRDFSLLQQMNANTIRIWKGDNTTDSTGRYPDKITNASNTINIDKTQNTLDLADSHGLKVIGGFWVNFLSFDQNNVISSVDGDGNPLTRQQIINNFVTYVNAFKANRSILFWAIGNENNYEVLNATGISKTPFENAFGMTQGDAIFTWLQETANFIDLDGGIIVDLTSPTIQNTLKNQYPATYTNILSILQQVSGQKLNPAQLTAWYSLIDAMAKAAHAAEGANFHPVALVNGEIAEIGNSADGATDAELPDLDIWGVNVYRGKSFGPLFTTYAAQSHKPLWISEYGVDAWSVSNSTGINNWGNVPNQDTGSADPLTQSSWDTSLWNEILGNFPVTIGGSVMEYSDEWWKPNEWYCTSPTASQSDNTLSSGLCNSTQNHFGEPDPASPDGFANQEWFGIMAISQNPTLGDPDVVSPRQLYNGLQIVLAANPWPTLTLNVAGSGTGTITSPSSLGPALNCQFTSGASSGICSIAVTKNQAITLNFSPANNSTVTNWGISGCAAGSSTCTVTPAADILLNVTVTAPLAPKVILNSNSFSYMSPASVYLSAFTSESGGSISKVEFYNGSSLIATSTLSIPIGPYSEFVYVWNNSTPGSYNVTAKAYDSNNNATLSAPATFTISGFPTVSLTANSSSSTAPATITLTANAAEAFGSIRQVAFYNGSVLLGIVTASPYAFVWNNVPAGSYSLTAVAFDRVNSTTSVAVPIVVQASDPPPSTPPLVNPPGPATVILASNSFLYSTPAAVYLSAFTKGAVISKVEFYNGSTLLGTTTSSTPLGPYSQFIFVWNNSTPGNYSLTAKVYDSNNNVTTSAPTAFTISALPTVNLTANSSSASAPATITLTANATELFGSIRVVAFYNGRTLLGTSSTSPYTFIMKSVPAGNYTLIAAAYDNTNKVVSSTPVNLTVSP